LREGHTDIKADPILQETCMSDLQKHCSDIPEGHGRCKYLAAAGIKNS